jgi:hypothetical protein
MTDKIRLSIDENTLAVVIRKIDHFRFEAFTEPHPIVTGYGDTGTRAFEDMVGNFYTEYSRLKHLERSRALPLTQQGALELMRKFSTFF